jgi:hypothetical protein
MFMVDLPCIFPSRGIYFSQSMDIDNSAKHVSEPIGTEILILVR